MEAQKKKEIANATKSAKGEELAGDQEGFHARIIAWEMY